MAILPPDFPVKRGTEFLERELERAKELSYPEDREEHWIRKDKVGIFEEVLTWAEYAKMVEIYQDLKGAVLQEGDGKVPRAIFQKIYRSLAGFQVLLKESTQGVLHPRNCGSLCTFYVITDPLRKS